MVAERDGALVGFIVWNREFFSFPFIWLVAVRPEHRRRGVARELPALCQHRARFSNVSFMFGTTTGNSPRSVLEEKQP